MKDFNEQEIYLLNQELDELKAENEKFKDEILNKKPSEREYCKGCTLPACSKVLDEIEEMCKKSLHCDNCYEVLQKIGQQRKVNNEVNNEVNNKDVDLDFEDGYFSYFNKDGELIVELGEPIEELVGRFDGLEKHIMCLETALSQKDFELNELVGLCTKCVQFLGKMSKELSTHSDIKVNFAGFEASQLEVNILNSKTYERRKQNEHK